MKAAVMRALRAPLSIEEIGIAKPARHEVLVRTAAAGVCHSDLHVLEGALPSPLPTVLGHEPAGVVEAVGAAIVASQSSRASGGPSPGPGGPSPEPVLPSPS